MIVHTNTGVRALESVNELTFTSGLIGKLLKLKSLFRYIKCLLDGPFC